MEPATMTVRVSAEVPVDPSTAFSQFVDELTESLVRAAIRFVPGPHGVIEESGIVVGRVRAWDVGRRIVLDWTAAPWAPDARTEVDIRFETAGNGTRIEVEHRGWEGLLGDDPAEWTGWVASELVTPFLRAAVPSGFGDWITDRRARRPAGPQARTTYGDPIYHRPNFRLLLDTVRLGPQDRLLEVGCGGGAFLKDALASGCTATGIDHSPEMVRLARTTNRDAVREGRLVVLESDASRIPVPDRAFTVALSTGVFGFLPRPLDTLREMHRALVPGGRLAVFAGTNELVGTPACPEPIASRLHFYEDGELAELARSAGFEEVEVRRPELRAYAIAAQIPAEALALFTGGGGAQLLLGRARAE
jgi:SAM-dependent methyltransferase